MRTFSFDEATLPRLTAMLHDQWLDLDSLRFDRDRGEVTLAVQVTGIERRRVWSWMGINLWHELVFAGDLAIMQVESLRVTDEAQIGGADVNEVQGGSRSVIITCGLPVRLEFSVSRVEISLSVSDHVVGRYRLVTFGHSPEPPGQSAAC